MSPFPDTNRTVASWKLFVLLSVCLPFFVGCSGNSTTEEPQPQTAKPSKEKKETVQLVSKESESPKNPKTKPAKLPNKGFVQNEKVLCRLVWNDGDGKTGELEVSEPSQLVDMANKWNEIQSRPDADKANPRIVMDGNRPFRDLWMVKKTIVSQPGTKGYLPLWDGSTQSVLKMDFVPPPPPVEDAKNSPKFATPLPALEPEKQGILEFTDPKFVFVAQNKPNRRYAIRNQLNGNLNFVKIQHIREDFGFETKYSQKQCLDRLTKLLKQEKTQDGKGSFRTVHVVADGNLPIHLLLDVYKACRKAGIKTGCTLSNEIFEKVDDINPLELTDIDPNLVVPDPDLQYNTPNLDEFDVPGLPNPDKSIGIEIPDKKSPPMVIPPPPGFDIGGNGAIDLGGIDPIGKPGGFQFNGQQFGGFKGRSGVTRKRMLKISGGTEETEAAVARGLHWLVRIQSPDGSWKLDGPFTEGADNSDEIAGTAFGLLPFLAAGHTHMATKQSKYDKVVEKGLYYLIRKQNVKNGSFPGGMYQHGLATIAVCEAYGLTQDPKLRVPAQRAVNYLVYAQHDAGGWRYAPRQAGDTSVSSWAIMALKSGQMAGLDVPEMTFKKAIRFLNSVHNKKTGGYGYTGTSGSYAMAAAGLLCRQHLQNWGPTNPDMIKGVKNILLQHPIGKRKHIYYHYYATQVMHNFGGEAWKNWNERMRDEFVSTQEKKGADVGSWSPRGDTHGRRGGRLMYTSMVLLSLEVYYRYLPLYMRKNGK